MITLIYRGIILIVLCLTIYNLYNEKQVKMQANAALVVIPLLLRMMMIK